jgi:hypothetical protein
MATLMTDVAENLGKIVGSQEVRIRNPLNDRVIAHYHKIGFSLAQMSRGATYYSRSIP